MPKVVSRSLQTLAVILAMAASAAAQTPYMVVELVPGSTTSGGPTHLTDVNGTLFFRLNNQFSSSAGLWKSDGTAAGTVKVTDLAPLHAPVAIGSTLFFGPRGTEIWKTDGTAAGTVLVKELVPGWLFNEIDNLRNLNGTLLFTSRVEQLWKSDGTANGTVMLLDVNTGTCGNDCPFISNVVVAGPLGFFEVKDSTGPRLWRTDGTSAGTFMVKDFRAGGQFPLGPATASGNRIFLKANDGSGTGDELWVSDGTPAGTFLVKDVQPGLVGSNLSSLADVNGIVYFFAAGGYTGHNGLWKSDGTASGTLQVAQDLTSLNMTNVDGTVFFVGDVYFGAGRELWKSNGSSTNTVLVEDINVGGDAFDIFPELRSAGGRLWFRANAGAASGDELWMSNGTASGTRLVGDINPGSPSSSPSKLTPSGGRLFFVANNGTNGRELWAVALPGPPPNISISDAVVMEGNAGGVLANFTVTLAAPSAETVTVQFATANNTATAPSDYASASGTVTFAPGDVSETVSVTVNGDVADELTESFFVNLSNASGESAIVDGQGLGSIIGDDTQIANPAAVYRLRHPTIGAYLFTVYPGERDSASLQYGYIYEGVCCNWFVTPAADGRTPLFRLYSGTAGEYFFTIYSEERDSAVANFGYTYEGVAAYCHPTSVPAAPTAWYRLRYGNKHIYTIYVSERDAAVAAGWTLEGVSCYLP